MSAVKSNHLAKRRTQLVGATALLLLSLTAGPGLAQGLQPGEAFATRFSGTAQGTDGLPAIDQNGTVGSILDLRAPGAAAQGPALDQRAATRSDHRRPDRPGVRRRVRRCHAAEHLCHRHRRFRPAPHRGQRAVDARHVRSRRPGAIYRLDASNGYKPRLFATVTLNGRQNSGAALGNIAYDRWNKQVLVSDLETGMIHRIGLDGRDMGSFDHGTQGRTSFVDAQTGQSQSLKPIAFDPSSQAKIANCEGRFDTTTDCWNIAEFEPPRVGSRRVARPERRNPPRTTRWRAARTSAVRTGTACRTTRSATRSGRCGSARTVRSIRAACGAKRCCRTSSPTRRTSPAPATAGRSPTSPSRPARAVRSCWSPSVAACATSASARRTRSPPRTRRAPSATSSTRAARGVRSAVTTSACTTVRGRARPSSTRTAPAARPSVRATRPMGVQRVKPTASSGSPATSCARPTAPATRPAVCRRRRRRCSRSPRRRRSAVPARRDGSARRARSAAGHVQPARPGDRQRPEPADAGTTDRSGSGLHGRLRHQRRCGRQPDPGPGRQERRDHDRRHQRVPDLPAGQRRLLDGLPAVHRRITAVASATTVPVRTRGSSATGAGTRTAAGRATTVAGRPATIASGRKVTGGT